MRGKILIAAVAIDGIYDATDAASQVARIIRANDRSLASSDLVQLPMVDGGSGTIDFLISRTLGSFLEVEATGASGEEVVAPIGFAGEDGKLAVMEMALVARVPNTGDYGTTAGIGELIQDALDEGAFSVILGHEEPIACDAGMGVAYALGVKFFDTLDHEINFARPGSDISQIARVDATTRSFSLLSSRIFIARSRMTRIFIAHDEADDEAYDEADDEAYDAHHAANGKLSNEAKENQAFLDALPKLAEIIRRDTGIHTTTTNLSASAVEFGLITFLGAEVRDGASLVLEASNIAEAITRGEFSECIIVTPSLEWLEKDSLSTVIELARAKVKHRAIIVTGGTSAGQAADLEPRFYLQDVALFQTPVSAGAGIEEKRRDMTMRLEKLMPTVLETLRGKPSTKEMTAKEKSA
jgi:glycerate 2-kinase